MLPTLIKSALLCAMLFVHSLAVYQIPIQLSSALYKSKYQTGFSYFTGELVAYADNLIVAAFPINTISTELAVLSRNCSTCTWVVMNSTVVNYLLSNLHLTATHAIFRAQPNYNLYRNIYLQTYEIQEDDQGYRYLLVSQQFSFTIGYSSHAVNDTFIAAALGSDYDVQTLNLVENGTWQLGDVINMSTNWIAFSGNRLIMEATGYSTINAYINGSWQTVSNIDNGIYQSFCDDSTCTFIQPNQTILCNILPNDSVYSYLMIPYLTYCVRPYNTMLLVGSSNTPNGTGAIHLFLRGFNDTWNETSLFWVLDPVNGNFRAGTSATFGESNVMYFLGYDVALHGYLFSSVLITEPVLPPNYDAYIAIGVVVGVIFIVLVIFLVVKFYKKLSKPDVEIEFVDPSAMLTAAISNAPLPDLPGVSFGEVLGVGQFAMVRHGTYHGKEVAIKIQSSYVREGEKMVGLNHAHIIKIHKIWHREGRTFIVMDYMPLGSLIEYYKQNLEKITVHYIIHFCQQIIDGMQCLVENHLVHCDLKMGNILVDENGDVRISDFGLSRDSGYSLRGESVVNIRWSPPEAFSAEYQLHSSFDIWSFGVLMWELFAFPARPWENLTSPLPLGALLAEGVRLEKPDTCPPDFFKVMQDCWEFDSTKRPTFLQLRKRFNELQEKYKSEQ